MTSDQTGERFERLEELFHRFADLPPRQRAAAMAELEAEDAALAGELERLLAADADRLLTAAGHGEGAAAPGEILDEPGRYRLIRRLGEGGMGAVWEAEQLEPIRRRVAVKLLRGGGLDGRRLVRRFLAEKTTLAQLEHPNIARVLDAGMTRDGRPFFTMELVDGAEIDTFCESEGLGVEDRLELFRQVCRAVEYAHECGVVHRDLKPSNLLVARVGSEAVVKVIDFGIARALDVRGYDPGLTRTGELLGTPSYMSPEQLAGGVADECSDVFSLGVVLYELLAGGSPFRRGRDTTGGSESRDPRTDGALAPSRWLRTPEGEAAAGPDRPASARRLSRRLRGTLDRIVLRAIELRPGDRYPSAGELERDLGRYLAGERVTPSGWRRRTVRRWARRPMVVAALGAAAALLVLLALQGGLRLGASSTVVERGVRGMDATDSGAVERGAREVEAQAELDPDPGVPGPGVRGVDAEAPPPGAFAAGRQPTVAVLPFAADSSERAARTADELTDLLSSSLARLAGLRVIEPASSRRAADASQEPAEIAARLGVESLVRGRLIGRADGLRVEAELIRAASGETLWSDEIEVARDGLWTVPVELAAAIAERLAVAPAQRGWSPLSATPAPRSEAVDAYLRGRYFWGRRTARDFALAERHFREAIAAAPQLALAHAGLADTFIMRALYRLEPPARAFPRAAEHARRALELDPGLAEGLTAQAAIDLFFHWELERALEGFERAVAAGPSFATARLGYADALLALGRFDEAVEQSEIMVALSPFDRGFNLAHADFLRAAGRLEAARDQIARTVEMAPDFATAYLMGAEIAGRAGDSAAVRSLLDGAARAGASSEALRLSEATAAAWLGDSERARALLEGPAAEGAWSDGEGYGVAQAFALAADAESAYRWLERAAAVRSPTLIFLGVSPAFDRLRSEARFVELAERLGLAG